MLKFVTTDWKSIWIANVLGVPTLVEPPQKLRNAGPAEGRDIAEVFRRLATPGKCERLGKTEPRKAGTQRQAQQSTTTSESTRYKAEVEVERPSWWDNLDATKNYGYPARETGRYGSYPSHDGFDDESES